MTIDETVFLSIHGSVIALSRTLGEEIWRTPLKGSDFVNLTIDGDRVLATTKGEVFCLDALTGSVLWSNELPATKTKGCGNHRQRSGLLLSSSDSLHALLNFGPQSIFFV